MVYTTHGTFVNGSAPAIDQTFCNDIDNCLTGNLGLAKVLLTTGSIARISYFSGSGSVNASHGLGATPDIIFPFYAGNFGSPPTHPIYSYNATSTNVQVVADASYSWVAMALKFTP
jgi:hypothetical protein